ncbi:B12-binding domain-containing radical SAM protein [Pseudothermotoga thermarum]|uniref:Radical SAM domain protein n=1 Tax=Pseudothermotoga thermarum DSM 5069 TaxID=688269 RepID=F7YXQ4_9THEM|nr:B12-binding domain-containing radical SAM protein [Pseudothermotoga thermarum]AEH50698.1 Radical SAM domain protein [Pseudothermotoga thermarum DSM 5069]
MRILLVNPWICDVAAYDFWLKPIGLLYVGAALKTFGIDVELVDLLNRHDPDLAKFCKPKGDKRYGTGKFFTVEVQKPAILKNIPRRYKRYGAPVEYFEWRLKNIQEPDAIFVTSTMTYWWPGVKETIDVLKKFFPKTPVVLGGLYARLYQNHAKAHIKADVIFSQDLRGLPSLLQELLEKEVKCDFDLSKWFEIFDPAYELYNKVGYLVFLTSLGCPFSCSYCLSPKLWEKFVQRDPVRVVEMIEKYIEIFKVKDIVFFDDAILVNKENHFKPLLRLLISKNFQVNYHLPNGIHARLLDEETALLMKEAGFKTIKLGYETSGFLQKKTGGKVFDEDLKRAVEILLKTGHDPSNIQAYVMVNMPFQKPEDVVNAIKFCKSLGISVSVNEYTPIPFTKDWYELVELGWLQPDLDPILLNNSLIPYWWKHGMDAQTVQKLKQLARNIYEKDDNSLTSMMIKKSIN